MCDLSRASQRLAPILRALSSSSHNSLAFKRNTFQIERLLSSQCSSSWAAEEKANYKWLRAADPWEAEMDAWNRNNTRIGIACLSVNSKLPIPEDMWKTALRHIQKQTLMLRLDIVKRGNIKWLCEINDMDLDVKLFENQTTTEVFNELVEDGINESPMKFRIVIPKPDDSFLLASVRKEFPFQYFFMLLSNHAICDGQSVGMVYYKFWLVIEDMLAGRNYMERLPFGEYTNGEELRELYRNMKIKLENEPETLKKEKEILQSTIKTPLLNEVFSVTENNQVGTKYSHYVLEDTIYKSFLQKCKSHGIKISSGVVAAINTAIVEMVRNAGLQKDYYHLSVMQNVDKRRYIKNNPMSAMGFFGGKIHLSYCIDSNIRENFWDHGKEINSRTSKLLKNDGPILQDTVRQLTLHPYDHNIKRGPKQMEWDYTFNNMLDLSPVFFSEEHLVKPDYFLPVNMTHNFIPFQIIFHTFGGITRLSLSYTTNCMTDDMAQELMERVLNVIRDMALT